MTIALPKPRKMSKKEILFRLLMTFVIALAIASAVVPAPGHTAHAQCVDGVDPDGDPCLDIQTDTLMGEIFKWANTLIPILLPIIAIGIGFQFGGNILNGIKGFFGSFRIG
ncbi:MAG: hypothetical protein R3E31_31170 [Chloroflexota bacterium]